ncbi:MAG TPA: BTAD domain-containing putative transcriptional regulator [Nocardioides sp.]|jgi:DNA-binding SARP family transcriptional activator|uniref:ATP-binding protein n=1 Tax=Nocardioides sp. TaxID=35761 RepID=UPI002E340B43|nr:BTAD domain-containing putative transcriptional regulator [Nocardioides sp.]HEX3929315.1 BTAD domain-containing putative transcriptional regulator [Nocardioides sp.]
MGTDALRFAVYGGPRVWSGDAELDLGPPQRRLLLALLMVAAGDAVGMDVIVETLWEQDPPDTALNVVHRHVGQLRRSLEPELSSRQPGSYVAAAGTGYRLTVSESQLDLLELRSLLAGPSDAACVTRAVEVAADRAGGRLPSRLALESLLAALEADRAAAGIAAAALVSRLGDRSVARRLLPGVQAIAHDHLFDEPLQAALIRILVAAGRRADALAHFGNVRALMDEELGLEPGPDLQAAQQESLADPVSAPAPTGSAVPPAAESVSARPAQLPVHSVDVVGRDDELAEVTARLRATGRSSVVCAVTGMGGLGKTTLALRCAQEVADDFPDGQLYAQLHGYDEEVAPTAAHDVLRGFLVALGVAAGQVPGELDDRAALFRSLVARSRVLVLLDNARDSEQVRPLLPGGAGCGVLVTSRRRLDELAFAGAFVLPLGELDRAEGLALLRSRIGAARVDAEPDAADAVVAACDGLPLALSIVAAQIARYRDVTLQELLDRLGEPSATLDALSGGARATDLRRILSWSHDALSEPAAQMFRCVGTLPGNELSLLAAVSLAGVDVASARSSLDELAGANLVTEVAPARFQIHQLLQAYARELLPDDEAAAARRRLVGHYVGTVRNAYLLHGRPPLCPLPEAAANTSPETFRRLGEAHAWYHREQPLLAALTLQCAAAGAAVESALLVLDARPLAQHSSPAGDLLPLATAALGAVQRAGGPGALAAELRRDRGLLLCRSGQRARGHDELVAALTAFEELGDAAGQASTLRNLARNARFAGDPATELEFARRSVEVARRELDGAAESVALTVLTESLTASGLLDEAVVSGRRSVELTRAHRVVAWEPHALEALADAYAAAGDFDSAIAHITEAHDIESQQGLGRGASITETRHHLYLAEFQYGAGDREAALASYSRYVERAEAFGPLSDSVAIVDPTEAALGDLDRVRRRIAELGG